MKLCQLCICLVYVNQIMAMGFSYDLNGYVKGTLPQAYNFVCISGVGHSSTINNVRFRNRVSVSTIRFKKIIIKKKEEKKTRLLCLEINCMTSS